MFSKASNHPIYALKIKIFKKNKKRNVISRTTGGSRQTTKQRKWNSKSYILKHYINVLLAMSKINQNKIQLNVRWTNNSIDGGILLQIPEKIYRVLLCVVY